MNHNLLSLVAPHGASAQLFQCMKSQAYRDIYKMMVKESLHDDAWISSAIRQKDILAFWTVLVFFPKHHDTLMKVVMRYQDALMTNIIWAKMIGRVNGSSHDVMNLLKRAPNNMDDFMLFAITHTPPTRTLIAFNHKAWFDMVGITSFKDERRARQVLAQKMRGRTKGPVGGDKP